MDNQRVDRCSRADPTWQLSVVLVLVGFVMAWPIYDLGYFAMANSGILFLLLLPILFAMRFGGAMVVGVGLFLPIKRPWLGAVIGLAVQIMITFVIYFTDPPS